MSESQDASWLIIDGYEDEPAAFGVPPYVGFHIRYICGVLEEKGIPYGYVPSQEFLANEAGLPNGVKTASIAIMEINKSAQEKYQEVVELINGLKA